MTFKEWYVKYFGLDLEDDMQHHRTMLVFCWNAAIASSLNAVETVVKQNIDENDVVVYIHDNIKDLLTKSR